MSTVTIACFQITENIIRDVRKSFGKDEESVKEDLRILKEWWRKQPHLPPNRDDDRLERFLLRNKFRIERTKKKIDNYYSLRTIYPQHFDDIRNCFDDILAASDEIYIGQSPTFTPRHERVVFCTMRSPGATLDWVRLFSYAFLGLELKLTHDYSAGECYVIDWSNICMQHYTSITKQIPYLLRAVQLYQEAYSGRIMALHFVNTPPFVDVFLALFKMLLEPKLVSKIVIHKSLEDLHESVDPKYLPPCLGGSLQDIKYYNDQLRGVILDRKDEIFINLTEISNEALRPVKSVETNNMFGIDGTFKKIAID